MTDTSKLGFFVIDRALWDHQIFKASEMSEREAWLWMISAAAWAETTHRVGSDIVPVPRGSFMVTLREMQRTFGWSSDTRVRNYLKKLEKCEMVSIVTLGQRNARKTHVSICNYTKYQSPQRSESAAKTQQKRSKNAVKKEDNNITTERDTNVSPKTPTLSPSKEIAEILGSVAGSEAVVSFVKYRKDMKKPLTVTAAKRLAKVLGDIFAAGGDPDDALGMAEEKGWQSIKAEWYFNAQGNNNGQPTNNPTQPRRAIASHDPHESTRRVLREIEADAQRGGNDGDGRLKF